MDRVVLGKCVEKYEEVFGGWGVGESQPPLLAHLATTNIHALHTLRKHTQQEWEQEVRNAGPSVYNRVFRDEPVLSSVFDMARLLVKASGAAKGGPQVTDVAESYAHLANGLSSVISTVDAFLAHLQEGIEGEGYVLLEEPLNEMLTVCLELIEAVGAWTLQQTNEVNKSQEASKDWSDVVLSTEGFSVTTTRTWLWTSVFKEITKGWTAEKANIAQLLYKIVIALNHDLSYHTQLANAQCEEIWVNLSEAQKTFEAAWRSYVANFETEDSRVVTPKHLKFTSEGRIFFASHEVRESMESLQNLMDQVESKIDQQGISGVSEENPMNNHSGEIEAFISKTLDSIKIMKTKLDVYEVILQGRNSTPKKIIQNLFDDEEKPQPDGSEYDPVAFNKKDETNEYSNQYNGDSDTDQGFEIIDEYFVAKGGVEEVGEVPELRIDSNLSKVTFRNVMEELSTKLTDRKTEMESREKNALKRNQGLCEGEDSGEEEESVKCQDELSSLDNFPKFGHMSLGGPPLDFSQELNLVLNRNHPGATEEFCFEGSTSSDDVE